MPTICVFYGISIRMYYDDHNPLHFHVFYNNYAAKIAIQTGEIIAGSIPKRVCAMAREWSALNKEHLLDNWSRCVRHEPLMLLKPLE